MSPPIVKITTLYELRRSELHSIASALSENFHSEIQEHKRCKMAQQTGGRKAVETPKLKPFKIPQKVRKHLLFSEK